MDEELISKKELLKLTDISYGQLYRWKRKNIIPEEWFIKKSSYTGQETFFPKDKILERINKIKDMKDDLSLDDLAEKFSENPLEVNFTKDKIIKNNLIQEEFLNIYETMFCYNDKYDFQNLLYISILSDLLNSGEVSFEEVKSIISTLKDNYETVKGKDCEILFIRKYGIGICILVHSANEIIIEENSKLVVNISMGKFIEELKVKLFKVMEG